MPTMNVFAQTEEDLYRDPFTPVKSQRSFDSILAEFNNIRSAEADQLRAQFWPVQQKIVELLERHRIAKLQELEEKHEAVILESRKLQKAFSTAKDESFAARQQHARLESVSTAVANKHEALIHEFKQQALLTKGEKAQWAERIAAAKKRAESAMLAESNQATLYNQLVYREMEAAKALTESVNAANDVQREINRLSK